MTYIDRVIQSMGEKVPSYIAEIREYTLNHPGWAGQLEGGHTNSCGMGMVPWRTLQVHRQEMFGFGKSIQVHFLFTF